MADTGQKHYSYLTGKDYGDVPSHALTYKALWRGFQENTSGHGFSRIYLTPGTVKKALWTLVCIGGFTAWGVHTTTLLVNFFYYHVDVTVQILTAKNLSYPAVTICNLNQIKSSKISDVLKLDDLYALAAQTVDDGDGNLGQRDQYSEYVDILRGAVADMDEAAKSDAGHQRGDFILGCTYKGYECYGSDVMEFFDPIYGNCFTFNGADGSPQKDYMRAHSTGPESGLTLMLNIEQSEYLPFTQSAGVRLVVHNDTVMPFPADEGINLEPGKLTMVGMRQIQIIRKGNPHGVCIDPTSYNGDRNLYEDKFRVRYTYQACKKTCYQKAITERCKCFDPHYPTTVNVSDTLKACRYGTIEQDECSENITQDFADGNLRCDCPLSCSESAYALTISSSQWPSDNYKTALFTKLTSLNNSNIDAILTNAADKDIYRRNFLKVAVYFEDLNYEEIEQKAAYTGSSLISDLGGSIGLWIGWSVITIVELFEFLSDVLILGCSRKSSKRAVGHSSDTPVKSIK